MSTKRFASLSRRQHRRRVPTANVDGSLVTAASSGVEGSSTSARRGRPCTASRGQQLWLFDEALCCEAGTGAYHATHRRARRAEPTTRSGATRGTLTVPLSLQASWSTLRSTVLTEYRLSERVLLQAGDKIRVSGGPYYVSHDAAGNAVKIKMAEKGVMVFSRYCELGASRWIEAYGKAGFAALHIGPEETSSEIPGLVRRPYKVIKVRIPREQLGGITRSPRHD